MRFDCGYDYGFEKEIIRSHENGQVKQVRRLCLGVGEGKGCVWGGHRHSHGEEHREEKPLRD